MKNLLRLLAVALLFVLPKQNIAQCTITNATSCVCKDGSSNCDLLPDITISWYGLQNYAGGPTEYPQTGAGADNGHLRVTGSTPNIGYGPFTVEAEQNGNHWFVCGTDTFSAPASQSFACPNGEVAKQILYQRIYHKDHQAMSFRDRIAGAMTYQQGGMHVDDWGIMSLRIENPLDPNPLNWSVVGWGYKQSFCLMDYGSCSTYNGHCRDDQSVFGAGTTLLNADFPNYGLGNSYGCSDVEQGCSVGYTDIYSESLNGMFIEIPPGTCNGDYWIVYEIDPHDYFVESNENNNYTVMPFTLALQDQPGNPVTTITADRNTVICGNDSVTLTANAGLSYLWSNGATTQNIRVGAGTYSVTVTTYCGTAASQPLTVTALPSPVQPTVTEDSICNGYSATLSATGNNLTWYDQSNAIVGTGNTFTTPVLINTATYTVVDQVNNPGTVVRAGKPDSLGGGSYYTGVQYEIFDALKPFVLKTVLVFANGAGNRTFELANSTGSVLQSATVNIPNGPSRVTLNFNVPPGTNLRLGATGTPNLWRNNVGVVYPYTITDTLSITGSSAGASFYYSVYDWEIEVGGGICTSTPATAHAYVFPCTGIDPVADLSNNFLLYPNPSTGVFNVEMTIPGRGASVQLSVYDMTGRQVYDHTLTGISGKHSEAIDLSYLSKGIYQLAILLEGRRYVRRMDIR